MVNLFNHEITKIFEKDTFILIKYVARRLIIYFSLILSIYLIFICKKQWHWRYETLRVHLKEFILLSMVPALFQHNSSIDIHRDFDSFLGKYF